MKGARVVRGLAVAAALVGGPALLAWAAAASINASHPVGSVAAAEPIFVDARLDDVSDTLNAIAELVWSPERPIVTQQGLPGIVTRVDIVEGQTPASGAVLYMVNSVPVVGLNTSIPLFRDLKVGDVGEDVASLEETLSALGVDVGVVDDRYDSRTESGVRSWLGSLGAPYKGSGLAASRVVWLPTLGQPVEEVEVEVGSPAPESAATIAKLRPTLLQLRISLEVAPRVVGGRYELRTAGGSYPIVVAPNDGPLVIALDGASAEALAHLFKPTDKDSKAQLVLIDKPQQVVVPASALLVAPSGTTCAWVRPDSSATLTARRLDVGTASFGGAAIISGIKAGERVLANPLDVQGRPPCQ